MAERSLFEKLINPTEEEKEEILSGVKEGQKYLNIISKEGFSGFVKRSDEEELIEQVKEFIKWMEQRTTQTKS